MAREIKDMLDVERLAMEAGDRPGISIVSATIRAVRNGVDVKAEVSARMPLDKAWSLEEIERRLVSHVHDALVPPDQRK